MENEWLQRHLNLSICGILSPRRPPLSFSFLISAPISNLANSLPPIFAWFYLNKLHLASPSWLFQSRLKPASAIQPALRLFLAGWEPIRPSLSPLISTIQHQGGQFPQFFSFLICFIFQLLPPCQSSHPQPNGWQVIV